MNVTSRVYKRKRVDNTISRQSKMKTSVKFLERCMEYNSNLLSEMVKHDTLPVVIEHTDDINPLNIQKCLDRQDKIRNIIHNTTLMENRLREMATIEHNYLYANCDHKWTVDYNGCWGPCDHTPMICEKCKI